MSPKKKEVIKQELIKILNQSEDRMLEEEFFKQYNKIAGGSSLSRLLELLEVVEDVKSIPSNESINFGDIDSLLNQFINGPSFKFPRFFRSIETINEIVSKLLPYDETLNNYIDMVRDKKVSPKKFIDIKGEEHAGKAYEETYCEFKGVPTQEPVEEMKIEINKTPSPMLKIVPQPEKTEVEPTPEVASESIDPIITDKKEEIDIEPIVPVVSMEKSLQLEKSVVSVDKTSTVEDNIEEPAIPNLEKPLIEPVMLKDSPEENELDTIGTGNHELLFDYAAYENWLCTKGSADEQYKILIKQLNGEDAVIIIGEDYGIK